MRSLFSSSKSNPDSPGGGIGKTKSVDHSGKSKSIDHSNKSKSVDLPGKSRLDSTAAIKTPVKSPLLVQYVDQNVLSDADKLIKDLQTFLDGVLQQRQSRSLFSKMVGIKSPYSKENFDLLLQRLDASEVKLKKIGLENANHGSELTTQASQLYFRVVGCIKHCSETSPTRKADLDFISTYIVQVSEWIEYLYSMVRFHQELIHQEQLQIAYTPLSSAAARPPPAVLRAERENDVLMVSKLTRLKKMHKHMKRLLVTVDHGYSEMSENLVSLEQTRARLGQTLARRTKADIKNLEAELSRIVSKESLAAAADHSRAHPAHQDCASTHLSGEDCLAQLESFDKQNAALTGRMDDLVHLKRRLLDAGPNVDSQS